MRILYYNNCWFTNVGEGFIDIGGLYLTKKIFGDTSKIACVSNMSEYYCKNAPSRRTLNDNEYFCEKSKQYLANRYFDSDWIIMPGMFGCLEYLEATSRFMTDDLVSRGCKVCYLGLGMCRYSKEEDEKFKRYIDESKPGLVITRDDYTYELLKDVCECINGIDCAFWCIDTYDPRGFSNKSYEVVTYNRSKEPEELLNKKNAIRPFHMQYSFRKDDCCENMMISDSPFDYLTIYANADRVYTDLVHATIPSLMYATPVKFDPVDNRSLAVYSLGGLQKNSEGFLKLDESWLNQRKTRLVEEAQQFVFNKR